MSLNNDLTIDDLLELLLFTASHLSGTPAISAYHTLAHFSVGQIHDLFCGAVKVFDNWSENYHLFLEEWQNRIVHHEHSQFSNAIFNNHIPAKYKKYELLISESDRFKEEKFEFLQYEFLNYLYKI